MTFFMKTPLYALSICAYKNSCAYTCECDDTHTGGRDLINYACHIYHPDYTNLTESVDDVGQILLESLNSLHLTLAEINSKVNIAVHFLDTSMMELRWLSSL